MTDEGSPPISPDEQVTFKKTTATNSVYLQVGFKMGNDNLFIFFFKKTNFLEKVYMQQYKAFPYMVLMEYS